MLKAFGNKLGKTQGIKKIEYWSGYKKQYLLLCLSRVYQELITGVNKHCMSLLKI